MPTPETRTEHEARAAAAAAKARTALTPRSKSSGQAHYGELRQKSVKDASHSSMRCVIDCRTQSAALQCGARAKNRSCRCP